MVDLKSNIEDLPPDERIKRIRALREQKQKELEQELEQKRQELEELEKEKQEQQELSEDLEEETLDEMERRRTDLSALEERIKEFSKGEEYVPEEEQETPQSQGYQSPVAQAQQDLQYLLQAEPTPARTREVARDLYHSIRSIADNFSQGRGVEQSEIYNMAQQMNQLAREKHDVPYMSSIKNFLNQIVDYKSDDEKRRH